MSVIDVQPIPESRSSSIDQEWVRKHVQQWRVITTNYLTDTGVAALAATPALYTAFPDDAGALLTSKSASQGEDPNTWIVTGEYTSRHPDPAQMVETPTDRPPVWSFSAVEYPVILEYDAAGNALVNAALQKYNPPIEGTRYNTLIEVEVCRAAVDVPALAALKGRVNLAAITDLYGNVYPAGSVKYLDFKANQVHEGEDHYFRVHHSMEYQPDGWNPVKYLNAGLMEIDSAGNLKAILDKRGQAVSEPWPLDADGKALDEDEDPIFLEFYLYDAGDFTVIV